MAVRYSDMGIEAMGARDFVARQRVPTIGQVVLVLLAGLLIGITLVSTLHQPKILLASLVVLFVILGGYILLHLMRSRDLLLLSEFQNALFASAMGLHNKFCLIIKRDGAIVYLDRSFQTLFPDFARMDVRTLEVVLKSGQVMKKSIDAINEAIALGTYQKVRFDLTDAQGVVHHVVVSIEPILRPAGFIMLRGREFVYERADPATPDAPPSILSRSSVTLLAQVMDHLNMGVYLTSPGGSIIYCNPQLESWLGYHEGEITERNLTIGNLLPPARNPGIKQEAANLEGEAQMERKVGGFVRVFLNQRLMHDEAGKLVGSTAIVHLLQDSTHAFARPNDEQF